MSDRFSMPDLKPAVWTTDIAPDEDLGAALGRVRRLGANVRGIAYTTAGARHSGRPATGSCAQRTARCGARPCTSCGCGR